MRIDVVSDVVCPWCFIGKRQLEAALAAWQASHPGEPAPEVVWHPFQLNPGLPEDGAERAAYLRAKFGSADTGRLYANVRAAAAEVADAQKRGEKINSDRIIRRVRKCGICRQAGHNRRTCPQAD